MKSDGTIWIDTKIDESGMEEGFHRMRDGADDVSVAFRNAGQVIEKSFSNISFNKTIENLKLQIKSLEEEFDSVSKELEDALNFDDDKAAEQLGAKRTRIYDRIARAREKLAVEVAHAAKKEAAAEEKASRRIIAAEEKEAAKKRESARMLDGIGDSADRFGARLRSIAAGAFVFNLLSAGLRRVTSYFGSALMANDQFAYAVNRLRGSLMVAFQPIYESVLPALVQLINWLNVAVQAVARFFAILAGKSYKDMQNNASDLNSTIGNIGSSSENAGEGVGNLGDAVEDAGEKAKEAEKYLAGFDEINRMLAEDAYGFGNAGSVPGFDPGEFDAPVFDEVEIPKEWETAIEELAMRIKDIFFEWENLNEEIVAEKLLTALLMLAGGIIGFKLGGVKGALIGMTVGAALGVILSSLIFDGDGKISKDELIKTLIAALAVIGGSALLFKKGFGSIIGITATAALGFILANIIFDGDGHLSTDELVNALISAVALIGGKSLVFSKGTGLGTTIGVTALASLSLILMDVIFDNDGRVTGDEIGKTLASLLLGLSGAGIGFVAGNIPGALVGAIVGLGIAFKLFKPEIDMKNSEVSAQSVAEIISDLLLGLMGAGIGFVAGNVPGALIGAVIGLGISFVLKGFGAIQAEGTISAEEILNGILHVLEVVGGAGLGFWILGGTSVGGPAGAVIGCAIGLLLSFVIPDVTFEGLQSVYDKLAGVVEESSQIVEETTDEQLIKPTEKKFEGLLGKLGEIAARIKDSIVGNMREAAQGVDQEFVEPTEAEVEEASANIQNSMEEAKDGILLSMESAAKGTQLSFIEPMEKESSELAHTMIMDSQITSDRVVDNWVDAARDTEVGFINPTRDNFANLSHSITNDFDTARQSIQSDWRGMPSWFQMNVTGPMTGFFNDLISALVSGFNKTAQQVAAAIRDLMSMLNQVLSHANGVTARVSRTTLSADYNAAQRAAAPALAYPTMDIPMLARGAVIPPNHKFLAVLGDQKSGTNVEAPLATIQEAVALVMEDMIQSNIAGHEATVEVLRQILEAVLGIELDGETLSRAINRHNRKMAMVRGV